MTVKQGVDALSEARRLAAAQLLFQGVARQMSSDVRVVAAELREQIPIDAVFGVSQISAALSQETDMRKFVLNGGVKPEFANASRRIPGGSVALSEKAEKRLEVDLGTLRESMALLEAARRSQRNPVGEAVALSRYIAAAAVMNDGLNACSLQRYDVSKFDRLISDEGLMRHFEAVNLPVFSSVESDLATQRKVGMGI
jgi:hypothetical protein